MTSRNQGTFSREDPGNEVARRRQECMADKRVSRREINLE